MTRETSDKRPFIQLVALVLIGIGLLIHLKVALGQPLFGDEILSIFYARSYTYEELFTHQLEIIHPNTLYIFYKLLMTTGVDATGLRVLHWIVFCVSLVPVYLIFRRLEFSRNISIIGLIAWTWSAYVLRYSYIIRMYGWGVVFLLASLWLTLKFVRRRTVKGLTIIGIVDILGILFVTGYWLYIVIKCTTFIVFFRTSRRWLMAIVGLTLLYGMLFVPVVRGALAARTAISQTYLYWVPVPKLTDWAPMLTSLLGLTSPAYFEGYSGDQTSFKLVLGLLCSIASLIGIYLYDQRKKQNPSEELRFFTLLTLVTTLLYLSVFLIVSRLSLPLFHIRQLFPVAIVLTIAITSIILKLVKNRQILSLLFIIPLLVFGVRKTVSYAFGSETIYPQHFTNRPAGIVLFTDGDVELAHNYCGASSYGEMDTKCRGQAMYIVKNQSQIMNFMDNAGNIILTSSAKGLVNLPSLTCAAKSPDFYQCRK